MRQLTCLQTSELLLQARRPPTGASPGSHDSPARHPDMGVRKPTLTSRSGATPSHLRHRSMSADLERTEIFEAPVTYPASPGEQQVCCNRAALSTNAPSEPAKFAGGLLAARYDCIACLLSILGCWAGHRQVMQQFGTTHTELAEDVICHG